MTRCESKQATPKTVPSARERLEREANQLLRGEYKHNPEAEYPFHNEAWLREARRREERLVHEPVEIDEDGAVGVILDLMLTRATLGDRQREVLMMVRDGLSLLEIARRMQLANSTVRRKLELALKTLRHAWLSPSVNETEDASIRCTFVESTRVPHPCKEVHCRPGQEQCLKDGICKRRWYLYHHREDELPPPPII